MDFWLDDASTDGQFQQVLNQIRQFQSGEVSGNMQQRGIGYKVNWGVALVEIREMAKNFQPSHVLALKLWNKQWRETMILATLLDVPAEVTEQQMDFWTKSFENSEIAEQASSNLWWKTAQSYAKALEWCRGKKHWTRYTAVHLVGRMAMSDKKSPDEMFEPFFEELVTLAKDPALSTSIYRTMVILANRSAQLRQSVTDFVMVLKNTDSEPAHRLAFDIGKGLEEN